MATIFVAGIYGVGKSTLCEKLSKKLCIPSFSAGDLISCVNGEEYGASKVVSDKYENQDILAMVVQRILTQYPQIILAGHFSIFTKTNSVDFSPKDVFTKLNIDKILLLEADIGIVAQNLASRDNRHYAYADLKALHDAEHEAAISVASRINCELVVHQMRFDETDVLSCIEKIR